MLIQRHAVESTLTGADWVFVYLKGSVKQVCLVLRQLSRCCTHWFTLLGELTLDNRL